MPFTPNIEMRNKYFKLISDTISQISSETMREKYQKELFAKKRRERDFQAFHRKIIRFIEGGEKIPLPPEERKARSLQRLKEYKAKMKKQNTIEDLI